MKKLLMLSILTLGAVGIAHSAWDVNTPAGSEAKSQGDDRIRELKVDISTALNHDGKFPGADTSNPRFHVTLSSGTTALRPTGDNKAVGSLYLNTQTQSLERWTGTSWVAYDLVPSTSILSVDISTDVAGDGLVGGNGTALALNASTTYFAVNSDTLTIKNLSISTGALATASVTSEKLGPNLVLVGTFTVPNQTYFFAKNSAEDADATGDGTVITAVDFDSEVSDVSGVFASDTFTVPTAGTWALVSHVLTEDASTSNACNLAFTASSSGSLAPDNRQGSNPDTLKSVYVGPLVKGETVTVRLECIGGAKVIDVFSTSYFQGTLLH